MCDREGTKMFPTIWNEVDVTEILSKAKKSGDKDPFNHGDLTDRIKRTLYYDPLKKPDTDTLSFSVTSSAVSRFRHVAPMPSRKLGHRYASRVARDACISPCALLLGLIYIERLKHKNPSYLDNISSSDLFLVSMMVSSKYLFDEGCEDEVFNDEWANSGDMDVSRVNKLEREFLSAIDWNLYVHPQQFSSMLKIAESDVALSNGRKRGWLTYSDLISLLDCHSIYKQLTQTAGILSKATCMCMVMYSGLVCLAALTTTALVSVSSSTSQNPTFGPSPISTGIEREENNTAPDSGTISDSFEFVRSTSDQFPGFSPESGESSCLRHYDRKRFRPIGGDIPDSPRPENYTMHISPSPDDSIVPDTIPEIPLIDPEPPGVDPELDRHSQQPKKQICSMLEAVLFMAHVPALCGFREEAPNECHNCGRPIVNAKSLPTCHRLRAFPPNCSIHFYPQHDLRILPRRTPSFSTIDKNSMLGVFNPTVPPRLQPPPNVTHFGQFPIIVH